ncbi:uncharacterized protein LOC125496782 [Beta vulgaris subsp. vulgaris]|uniref:uncharacterized protein LOC125496782 n=1 Tax=Beta vulgaris subsp. vulgaris TaxID=3555 RepID=UPI0025468F54|nr:uncharacterized protein LOC125496782 [Beta vulgaris subsp. vulgaris]
MYDLDLLPHDPGTRRPITSYPPNDQEAVRRGYITKKPCRPRTHDFPQREIGDKTSYPGGDSFVNGGFRSWNKPDRFEKHIGGINSAHNQAQEKYRLFTNPKASINESLNHQSAEATALYKARLTYSLKCLRFLLQQGLAFRGHDESEVSSNKGNFLELLTWLAKNNKDAIDVVMKNAPGNNQMIAPSIQKELINSCAKKTTKLILEDVGVDYFGILADESSDISQKEQLGLCLRYVNKKGSVCERFFGIVHVEDTSAMSLKKAIESLLIDYSLSLSKVRGQGYDGASNMRGEINGLKTLIMNETPSAYYVHCFAHQLQLTLVAVAKDNGDCIWLFEQLGYLLNVIGVSCKCREMLRVIQAQEVVEALNLGEIESGQYYYSIFQDESKRESISFGYNKEDNFVLNIYLWFGKI